MIHTHTHPRAACRVSLAEDGGWLWYWPAGTSDVDAKYRRAEAKYKRTSKNPTTPPKRPPASRGSRTPTKKQRTAAGVLVNLLDDTGANDANAKTTSEKSGEQGVGVELSDLSESDDGGAEAASLKCNETLSAAK